MTQPVPYLRQFAFLSWSEDFPTTPHSGQHMDTEFNAVKTTIDQVLVNMALLQRDDGKLHNSIVGVEALGQDVFSLIGNWTPRGTWLTATAYAVRDQVTQSSKTYVCLVAHTSGVFATDLAANKWMLQSSTGIAPDGSTAITADIPFSAHKITGLSAGVAGTDAVNLTQATALAAAALASATALIPGQATESVTGIGQVATDAEMTTGTDDTVFGTAKKIATYVASRFTAFLAAAQTFTALVTLQHSKNTVQALTDAATIAWDVSLGNVATVTLGANRTLGAPTNVQNGAFYFLKAKQDGTGTRTLSYNAIFDFGTAGAPTLTTAINKADTLSFYYNGTSMLFLGIVKGFAS